MKLITEKLTLEASYSFVLQKDVYPFYPTPWHCHPEYELVLVLKSSGVRTVGDSVEGFTDGDLVFIGPNLPHCYQNDPIYYRNIKGLTAEAIVIHFDEDFLGKQFFHLPEMTTVQQLFKKSKLGFKVIGNTRKQIGKMMKDMSAQTGYQRILSLLNIINLLAHTEEYTLLVKPGYVDYSGIENNGQLEIVNTYIMENFRREISLPEIAEIANMSIPSFCRFFKAITRKTFSEYITDLRIGYACRLLAEDKYNISQICYESGFNTLSNFNRQFKKLKFKTPLQYKHDLLHLAAIG